MNGVNPSLLKFTPPPAPVGIPLSVNVTVYVDETGVNVMDTVTGLAPFTVTDPDDGLAAYPLTDPTV